MNPQTVAESRNLAFASLFAVVLAIAGCGRLGHSPNQPVTMTISAAISLKEPLQEISEAYQQSHPGERVACNFGASGTLQHQIEQGAPVDIFVSAGEAQMDALERERLLVPGTRRDLLSNQMALVVPAKSPRVSSFADLRRSDVKSLAVGNPQIVPAGMYAKQVLEHLGLLPAIRRKLVFATDVRQVLAYVETSNADAGLVYVTDARITSAVRVAAIALDDSHLPILYPVALLTNSKSPEAARSLLDALESSESLQQFKNAGFSAVGAQGSPN